MKKLMKKKNNKGFSLVELIVVVLILGILAVALAPQVMKWVGTARTNSDSNQAKTYQSAIQEALTDWQQYDSIPTTGSNAVYVITDSTTLGKTNDWGSTSTKLLSDVIDEYTAKDYHKPQKEAQFTVTVELGTGKVTVVAETPAAP